MSNFAKLQPGTELTVGGHKVKVLEFLSVGGFAHIYKVSIDLKHDGSDIACLKRVVVPTKAGLQQMRNEVDVMKVLRQGRSIVRYYDSHAERLQDDSYQVLVLMELCPNKSLLDYMNQKIRTKLAEPEILKIMLDIAYGIYEMHKLKLIHRDIKIENVLIDANHNFKLCDFGSTSPPLPPALHQAQFQALSHDILYQTTPQYRLPEMVDLYRGLPIDEKSDIWAFGCFLYKLCFYTTPFEAKGDIAIVHASFHFPSTPVFSGDLNNLIIIMLQENPIFRPNIYQVIRLLSKMMGMDFETLSVEDLYNHGDYDFLALSEYQQHLQNTLTKQQEQMFQQQQSAAPLAQALVQLTQLDRSSASLGMVQTMNTSQESESPLRVVINDGEHSFTSNALSDLSAEIPDFNQLENAAERYPSLEDIAVENGFSDAIPTRTKSHSQIQEASPSNTTDISRKKSDSQEYARSETWQKQFDGPTTNAELLADDIFSEPAVIEVHSTYETNPSPVETTVGETSHLMSPSNVRMDPQMNHQSVFDILSNETLNYYENRERGSSSQFSDNGLLNNESINSPSQPSRTLEFPRHSPISGLTKVYLQISSEHSQHHSLKQVGSDICRNNSNPWGNYRVPSNSIPMENEVKETKFGDVQFDQSLGNSKVRSTERFLILTDSHSRAQDLVTESLANLDMNSKLHKLVSNHGHSLNKLVNLIDLESEELPVHVPTLHNIIPQKSRKPSFSNVDTPSFTAPITLSPVDVSLVEIMVPEFGKTLKKRITSFQSNAPLSFQEEVIDFASDDESPEKQSNLSRMSIRKSLKSGRKSSESKRSESSHSEHRKRSPFFGGGSSL